MVFSVSFFDEVSHLGIGKSGTAFDDRVEELRFKYVSFTIKFDAYGHRQPFHIGLEATRFVRQPEGKHRDDPVGEVNARTAF